MTLPQETLTPSLGIAVFGARSQRFLEDLREDDRVSEQRETVHFRAMLELHGKTATGFEVAPDVLERLGSGKRPAVVVTIGAYTYRTTVGSMGGRAMVPLSAENRTAAGVQAGAEVEVGLAPDREPRTVEVPDDLGTAIAADPAARATFESLAPSHLKEWVRWVIEAKKPETRASRVGKAVEALAAGRRAR